MGGETEQHGHPTPALPQPQPIRQTKIIIEIYFLATKLCEAHFLKILFTIDPLLLHDNL
jgi:hypothetical protein